MNQPTPAIVTQRAVRRLPRLALLLFCAAYVLPGFIGREPWKNADVTAFGYMMELATGRSHWLAPQLTGLPADTDSLLPYWLGALAVKLAPAWIAPDFAVRIPFVMLLVVTLIATWQGVYHLGRSVGAQPVAFAFGGEANTIDYARAMADGGLLALMGCLGLAQLAHETTPALAQLCFTAVLFYAFAAAPSKTLGPALGLAVGLTGLVMSGAPAMATLFGVGGLALTALGPRSDDSAARRRKLFWAVAIVGVSACAALLAWQLQMWRWRITGSALSPAEAWLMARGMGNLLLWFTWPAWPLALWTLWRWRRQLSLGDPARHILLPLWFAVVAIGSAAFTQPSDRTLLLGLPALATLAAFALPTFKRSATALIDWFTLLFFTLASLTIWVIWVSLQTGVPRQPALNVARLAPGFEPSFSAIAFAVALAATLAWAWLVKWRVGRHRPAIWTSLVLPASGTALCWLLLMTLWLPVLDYARSYKAQVRLVAAILNDPPCVEIYGLNRGQISAFTFHGTLRLQPASRRAQCPWLLVDVNARDTLPKSVNLRQWDLLATIPRPADKNDDILVYQRVRR
ncbi:MAG: hypothetical protein CVU30_11745 [Betaproteobacteria bacterium HGW-Betaproteobacteria-3]|nr:MAG: hypothetical protein CVU30_11745 [Betaproteobacteria bacterium HGW-Betaproteobacteria-3]